MEQFYHNQIKIVVDFRGSLKICGSDPCPDSVLTRTWTQILNITSQWGEGSWRTKSSLTSCVKLFHTTITVLKIYCVHPGIQGFIIVWECKIIWLFFFIVYLNTSCHCDDTSWFIKETAKRQQGGKFWRARMQWEGEMFVLELRYFILLAQQNWIFSSISSLCNNETCL